MMARRRIDRPAAEKKLLDALKGGNTIDAAASYAGIDRTTVYAWAKNPTFATLIKDAEAQAEVRNVALIQQAAQDGSWQAAAWWLERRKHERWRKRENVAHTGPNDGPVQIAVNGPPVMADFAAMTEDEVRDFLTKARQRIAAQQAGILALSESVVSDTVIDPVTDPADE